MWVNGLVVDALARRGYDQGENPQNGDCYRSGAVGAGHLAGGSIVHASPGGGFFISMALFCVHFAGTSAWGLVAGNGGGA